MEYSFVFQVRYLTASFETLCDLLGLRRGCLDIDNKLKLKNQIGTSVARFIHDIVALKAICDVQNGVDWNIFHSGRLQTAFLEARGTSD